MRYIDHTGKGKQITAFFLASQITMIFTWSREAAHLSKDLVLFIRMFSCFYMSLTIWTSLTQPCTTKTSKELRKEKRKRKST